VFYSKTGI